MKNKWYILLFISAFLYGMLQNSALKAQVIDFFPTQDSKVVFDRDNPFTFMWTDKYLPEAPFTFVLVALLPGQKPDDAINKNPPIYTEQNIMQYYINYPWYAPDLTVGKYVWRLTSSKGTLLSLLDFELLPAYPIVPMWKISRLSNSYAYLKETPDGGMQTAYDRQLKIHYKEAYWVEETPNLRFRILNDHRIVVAETSETGAVKIGSFPPVPIKYGDNWLTLKLEACTEMYKYYTLEVWNAKGELLTLPFYCASSEASLIFREINNKDIIIIK